MGIVEKISWKIQVTLDARAALGVLCEQLSDELFRFALSMTGNREYAQDTVQEVFAQLSGNLKLVRSIDEPQRYLFRAVRYTAMKHQKRVDRYWEEIPDQLVIVSDELPLDERMALQQALAKLPAEQREVVILKEMLNWSFREIAERLEISLNTAASRHRYALAKLRQELAPAEEAAGHV
jgi:RNA polymerase sigma-70 factor, ECF subfamily